MDGDMKPQSSSEDSSDEEDVVPTIQNGAWVVDSVGRPITNLEAIAMSLGVLPEVEKPIGAAPAVAPTADAEEEESSDEESDTDDVATANYAGVSSDLLAIAAGLEAAELDPAVPVSRLLIKPPPIPPLRVVADEDDSEGSDSDADAIPIAHTAGKAANMPQDSDDDEEEGGGGGGGVLRTKNEVTEDPVAPVEVALDLSVEPLSKVGEIHAVMPSDGCVVVKTDRGVATLDEGSLLVTVGPPIPAEGGGAPIAGAVTLLGKVCEVFGPVTAPHYVVRLPLTSPTLSTIAAGDCVSAVTSLSKRLEAAALLASQPKGCDASNVYDEEVRPEELAYSDDEQEMAAKQKAKQLKRGAQDIDTNDNNTHTGGRNSRGRGGRGAGGGRSGRGRGAGRGRTQFNSSDGNATQYAIDGGGMASNPNANPNPMGHMQWYQQQHAWEQQMQSHQQMYYQQQQFGQQYNPNHQPNFNPNHQPNFNPNHQANYNPTQQANYNPNQQANYNPNQQANFGQWGPPQCPPRPPQPPGAGWPPFPPTG